MSSFARATARLAALAALTFWTLGAHASSSILDSISTSVGSSSTSLRNSSNSSTGLTADAGPYEVTEMVAMDDQPDNLRLSMRALQAGSEDFFLILPRQVAQNGRIAVGTVVEAQPREYGVAFAVRDEAGAARTFFLVLHDEWYRELDSRRVTL